MKKVFNENIEQYFYVTTVSWALKFYLKNDFLFV